MDGVITWSTVRTYLFAAPGPAFNYYLPILIAIVAAIIFVGYHYLLEARRRFRNYRPVLRFLDHVAAWTAGLAVVAALLLLVRHGNVPVLAWRIWLYLYVVVAAGVFFAYLFRLYGRLPRQLAAHDNDLLKRRYLPPANQRQVAKADPGRRTPARR
jgi:drug/metabolite transporter (DMT)-like permease